MDKRIRNILIGPLAFAVAIFLLQNIFGFKAAVTVGLVVWMGLWWILRPVDIAVTSFLPIAINALFDLIPAGHVISQYFSEIVVLLVGSDIISLTWTNTGLDKRLAVKALCFIGTDIKQQILVWLCAATLLSTVLPNVVVAMIMLPIASAMLRFSGLNDSMITKISVPIYLAVAWGSGVGGFGSPIGSSANLTAVSYLEGITGHEFMYVDWMGRFIPILLLVLVLNAVFLLIIPTPIKKLSDTKEYFAKLNMELGKMQKGEWIGLILFSFATLAAFARPLFADLLPAMRPAYVFFFCGMLCFVLKDGKGNMMVDWKQVEKELMWGMFFLFAGGLALGKMVTETGAAQKMAELITTLPLSGGLETMGIFVTFTTFLAEISSNTASASISIPVVQSISQEMGLNPVPYVLVTIVAFNCAYVLPVSTRAIPVSYGLEPGVMFKYGIMLTMANIIMNSVVGYLVVKFLPVFYQI
ncbi:MAG: SLC13 family permease [Phascolarctobacterium sp.]|nr:SLC13 family permease [Phascolarctobacterium sp.]